MLSGQCQVLFEWSVISLWSEVVAICGSEVDLRGLS